LSTRPCYPFERARGRRARQAAAARQLCLHGAPLELLRRLWAYCRWTGLLPGEVIARAVRALRAKQRQEDQEGGS